MCGITGIVDIRATRPIDPAVLLRMNDAHYHRGPDEGDIHVASGLGLGHRRLSIIDLATGQQPLFNADRSVVIVFNGEIYNYQSLMCELSALGYVFRTQSDTEVIVHAWEAWGEACVQRLRGMFAFVIWDEKRQTVFMARDRLGVKPLYYACLPDGYVLFGSELKSLLAYPGLSRDLDLYAVEEYFAFGYVPEPRSIYRAIRKLPAAHTLTWRRGAPTPEWREYWDVRFSADQHLSEEQVQNEFIARLRESVQLRMIAEVPLGAFLSGGVDSSAVVAMMAGLSTEPVNTCTIAFDEKRYDESYFARMVAERYGTRHFVDHVDSDDFDLIDTLARTYDEPYADSSAIPTYRVCQLARTHVTVALSGDGGDESGVGYRRYRWHAYEERWRARLPLGVRQALFGTLGRWYPKADWAPRPLRAKATLQALALNTAQAYALSVSIIRDDLRASLYSPELRRELGGYQAAEVFQRYANRYHAQGNVDDPVALAQYIDLHSWLPERMNTKVDRASMAHSLEVREPLMDHVLVEWLASLPTAMKLRGSEGKWLMKKALEPHLPHDVLYRPKMGFSIPLAEWLRGPLKQRLNEAIMNGALVQSGLFDSQALQRLVHTHQSGLRDVSAPLWSLLMFDAFLRQSA